MKKINNKGYFLAETIVVIALVTTIVAYVFPNVLSIYNNYKNTALYYDQTKDIYTLKALYEYMLNTNVSDETTPANITGWNSPNATHDYISYYTYNWRTTSEGYDISSYPDNTGVGCKELTLTEISPIPVIINGSGLQELYIISYMQDATSEKYNFNLYLKRLKKNTTDNSSYRLIGVFKEGDNERYASIKIENPNPKRNCNL